MRMKSVTVKTYFRFTNKPDFSDTRHQGQKCFHELWIDPEVFSTDRVVTIIVRARKWSSKSITKFRTSFVNSVLLINYVSTVLAVLSDFIIYTYFPIHTPFKNHSKCLLKQTRFSFFIHLLLLFPHFLLLLL